MVTIVSHTVQRGETIEAIAEYYHVSVEEIYKANPNAKELMFAGMILEIPVRQGQKVGTTNNVKPNDVNNVSGKSSYIQSVDKSRQNKVSMESSDASSWVPAFEIGFGFIKGASNYQYEATAGVNYCFPFKLYAGARIGYNSCNYNMIIKGKGKYASSSTVETHYHFIEVPLEIGYALTTSNGLWGIAPFGSFNTNIGLTAKTKTKIEGEKRNDEIKIGGKIGLEARLGLRLRLSGFNISGSYRIPLNEKQESWAGKDAYPEISIGYGF